MSQSIPRSDGAQAVIGGMIAVTLLGVFLTPLFYLSARRWLTRGHLHSGEPPQEPPHA